METLSMEDLCYWDPIGDLHEGVGGLLPDNWESELGMGPSKGHLRDVIEEGDELPEILAKEPLLDFPDELWNEWMESKICFGNMETGDPAFLDDVVTILDEMDRNADPNKNERTIDASLESSLNKEIADGTTPPDSPQSHGVVPDVGVVVLQPNSCTSSSYEIIVEPITPPGTPEEESVDSDPSTSSSSPSSPALRSKPYGTRQKRHSKKNSTAIPKTVVCSENKKSRKRDQNRDAAMRYRLKKREEAETMGKVETSLMEKNKELKDRVESLSSEIKYLKGLMKEIFLARTK